ncbi:MBL fold metallo-hydrolase [Rhodonellum sp.]|uniref:MBL fold metallo-hydrolase n=1 Tax=Rhodonellum sp. TaxID=2231180 RepID=UPI0027160070|nr:MBL fold metallo-hydrolase [Rhodonellum sp.]MDO9553866.1 MBL fold metallo-hydrolase [Rhodonellum sp.]
MKVSIKGVRGSIPTSSPETSYFGGNTSCVTVVEDNCLLILDGGSGMQKVILPDQSTNRVDILLTHLHFDHIQGLGFFNPLFEASKEVHIWAPVSTTQSLLSRLSKFLSPPLFPVLMRDLPCQLTLHEISNSSFEIGPFQIDSLYVIHPGPTVGLRIKSKNSVLAYIPDHEPALGPAGMIMDKKWISGFDLVDQADLLIHDAQFTAEEYKGKIGWGHSGMEDVIKLATFAGVKKLLFTHHDPSRTDAQLKEIMIGLKETHSGDLDFEFAREGMEIELD